MAKQAKEVRIKIIVAKKLTFVCAIWFTISVILGIMYLVFDYTAYSELRNIANKQNVEIRYVKQLENVKKDTRGKYNFWICKDKFITVGAFIEILETDRQNNYILAHELGHHFAIKYYNNTSEEAANNMSFILLCYCYTQIGK